MAWTVCRCGFCAGEGPDYDDEAFRAAEAADRVEYEAYCDERDAAGPEGDDAAE